MVKEVVHQLQHYRRRSSHLGTIAIDSELVVCLVPQNLGIIFVHSGLTCYSRVFNSFRNL